MVDSVTEYVFAASSIDNPSSLMDDTTFARCSGLMYCAICGTVMPPESGSYAVQYMGQDSKNGNEMLPRCLKKWVHANDLHRQQRNAADKAEDRLKSAIQRNERRIVRLRELCADEVITAKDFAEDRERLLAENRGLGEELVQRNSPGGLLESFSADVSFANQALSCFRAGDKGKKHEIVAKCGSNLFLKNRKLLFHAKKPFVWFREKMDVNRLVTRAGIEPATVSLKGYCSTS